MWYAVYRSIDGSLASGGSSVADVLPDGMAAKSFPARPDPARLWNAATLDWDIDAPAPVQAWTPLEFMQRFTVAERVAVRAARLTDPVIDDFLALLEMAGDVRSDSATVQQGLGYLVSVNLLTGARAAGIGGG